MKDKNGVDVERGKLVRLEAVVKDTYRANDDDRNVEIRFGNYVIFVRAEDCEVQQ